MPAERFLELVDDAHPERYPCGQCRASFSDERDVVAHRRIVHPRPGLIVSMPAPRRAPAPKDRT